MKQIPFEKSFASHVKSIYWSSKNDLQPKDVRICSGNKFLFNCGNCNHEFEKSLHDISKNSWCQYCSSTNQKLCENKDCIQCFDKSFASQEKSKFWSNINKLNPRQVFKSSDKKIFF